MKAVLQFIKNQWLSLLCGVVSIAAVAVAVLGLLNDQVVKEMQTRVQKASEISRLRSNPKNEDVIRAEQRITEEFEQKYEAALDYAASKNRREPILAGVFPDPGQRSLRYRFKEVYHDRLYDLPRAMGAGGLPTPSEIRNEQEILDDIARRQAEQEAEASDTGAVAQQPVFGGTDRGGRTGGSSRMGGRTGGSSRMGGGRTGGSSRMGGRMGGPPSAATPPTAEPSIIPPIPDVADAPQSTQLTPEAEYRAQVRKARNVPVYAVVDGSAPSFDVSPIIWSNEPPTPREMWYAQVGLWVQQDIAEAIARTNQEAARALPSDTEANVTNMPVKRLVNVDIQGYLVGSGVLAGFDGPMGGGGGGLVSFTGRTSNEQFDVLRFTVTVVMDQRDIHQFVDAMTRVNFYQLIDLDFEREPPDVLRADGFFYGSEPIIRATLTFEGYMARKVFKEMMPEDVLIELGIKQPSA